ncbi:hypothetical protein GYMLUDRAFT_253066 [Collybiopsis luxurians FD-317 M1]|uniref:Uncharacterized protein n=1 Tax=Collybiopsis luxurians FD-317 M1 TaxID=944289 RepID=A0A0D0AJH1_9AGAR|nr:hypothetical protein GYMLUDRAFT_253066 [Collybiopsis luxurians FD-317 M1]
MLDCTFDYASDQQIELIIADGRFSKDIKVAGAVNLTARQRKQEGLDNGWRRDEGRQGTGTEQASGGEENVSRLLRPLSHTPIKSEEMAKIGNFTVLDCALGSIAANGLLQEGRTSLSKNNI